MFKRFRRRFGVLLVFAQLLIAWAPACAFACASLADESAAQLAVSTNKHGGDCACGMQALCHAVIAPALAVEANPQLAHLNADAAPAADVVPLLTRYIAPLPEPPVS